MKRSLIASALISACFISTGAFAVDTGRLTINGEITAATCTFEPGTENIQITMPKVFVSDFEGVMSGQALESGKSIEHEIIISCSDSENKPKAIEMVANKQIPGKGDIIGTNDDNVGYYVYLGNDTNQINLDNPVDITGYENGSEGSTYKYRVPLTAKYMKIQDGEIKAGTVDATVLMRINNK